MKLLTKAIARKIPALYAQEEKGGDAIVYLKMFFPWGSWSWYVIEACAILPGDIEVPLRDLKDPAAALDLALDVHCFGLVDGDVKELGYFSLREIANVRGPLGLCIERDAWWQPKTLREVWPEGPWGDGD